MGLRGYKLIGSNYMMALVWVSMRELNVVFCVSNQHPGWYKDQGGWECHALVPYYDRPQESC